MASPIPKSPGQLEKNKKYDRQLRLWNDHGQALLESSHVCLINANALGTEILKSLVLPGIGAFTIVDGHKITDEDIGSNFFLDVDNIGKSRAEFTTRFLLELNPDVRGDYINEGVEQILQNSPDFLNNFTIVIAAVLPEKSLVHLSRKLWDLDIPLIACRTLGFVGYLRVQIKEHTIIETHPDNEIPDLRLDKPFDALKKYFDTVDFDELDLKDHSHFPYVVILHKYLKKWMNIHHVFPSSYLEKEDLKKLIYDGFRKDENGIPMSEDNFDEAIRAVNTSVRLTTVPQNVQDILNDGNCINLNAKSKPFWIIAKAVREFIDNEGNGLLPLKGALPDMIADTNKFVTLQQIYHKQAVADAETIYRRTLQLLRQLGRSSDSITERDVKLFCRHCSELLVQRGTCIADEYDSKPINANAIVQGLENPESMMIYYVMLRGIEKFKLEYSSYPGEFDEHVEPDIVKLKSCISKLLGELGCGPMLKDDYVHEFCRFGGAELHSVSATVGAIVAQEAVKFITKQYIPIQNTFVFDAVTCSSSTFFL